MREMAPELKKAIKKLEGHSCLECLYVHPLFDGKRNVTNKEIYEAMEKERWYQDRRACEIDRYIDAVQALVNYGDD